MTHHARPSMLAVPIALPVTLALAAAPALAQDFYTINASNNIQRWSGGTSTPVAFLPSLANPEGLAVAPDGMLYACGWTTTSFFRVNPANGQWTQLPSIQPITFGSFFKDLAWDPITNSLMALHYGIGQTPNVFKNRLVSINVATMQATLLGEITGINPANATDPTGLGLAIDPAGNRFIQVDNRLYALGTGLAAQALPATLGPFSTPFNGLAASNAGIIVGGPGLWNVNPDGSTSVLSANSGNYRDVAFAIPTPGVIAPLGCALLLMARRRR